MNEPCRHGLDPATCSICRDRRTPNVALEAIDHAAVAKAVAGLGTTFTTKEVATHPAVVAAHPQFAAHQRFAQQVGTHLTRNVGGLGISQLSTPGATNASWGKTFLKAAREMFEVTAAQRLLDALDALFVVSGRVIGDGGILDQIRQRGAEQLEDYPVRDLDSLAAKVAAAAEALRLARADAYDVWKGGGDGDGSPPDSAGEGRTGGYR